MRAAIDQPEAAVSPRLSSLQATAMSRRSEQLSRYGVALYGVGVLWLALGVKVAAVWFVALAVTQLFTILAFRRFENIADARTPSRLEVVGCGTSLFVAGLVYSGVAAPLWLTDEPWWRLQAIFWLCGVLVNVTLNMHQDREMFRSTVASHLVWFAGLPIFEFARSFFAPDSGGWPSFETGVILLAVVVFSAALFHALRMNGAAATLLRAARERALERQAEAEAANEAKGRFLAVMSHELRTPMNGVLGMTRLLMQSDLTQSQREHASALKDAGEMLVSILNDILDFSKMEAGRIDLELGEVEVPAVISSVIALWRPRAAEKGISLEARIDADTPSVIEGDAIRVRQILSNLVSNAVKFTEEGHVRIEVNAKLVDETHAQLSFAVVDTGCGVDRAKVERLFEAFEQADNTVARRYGGAGLGLAIARRLARLMRGDITVVSEPGVGSEFAFDAPFRVVDWTSAAIARSAPASDIGREDARASAGDEPSEDPDLVFEDVTGYEPMDDMDDVAPHAEPASAAAAASVAVAQEPLRRRLRICAVEDQIIAQRQIEAAVERYDAVITFAEDGATARRILGAQRFDLVLVDHQTTNRQDVDLIRSLREDGGVNAATPILALCDEATSRLREQLMAAGATDVAPKPNNSRTLRQVIGRVLVAQTAAAPRRTA